MNLIKPDIRYTAFIITSFSSEYIRRYLHRILSLRFGILLPLAVGIPNAVLIVVPFMLTATTPVGAIFNTLTFPGVSE